jgi:ABC-type transporter Mla MlaB component
MTNIIKYSLNTTKLTLDNISEQINAVSELLLPRTELEINLSNIQRIDSAGVAFLLEIKKIASTKSCKVKLTSIPSIISHLCHLYDINL